MGVQRESEFSFLVMGVSGELEGSSEWWRNDQTLYRRWRLNASMRRYAGGIQQGAARSLWQESAVLQHTSCSQPYGIGIRGM